MRSFLARSGFVERDTKTSVLWTHTQYSNVIITYTDDGTGKLRPESVRNIAAKLRMLEDEKNKGTAPEPLNLPPSLREELDATRQNGHVTLWYKDFPEFRVSRPVKDISDAALEQVANVVRITYKYPYEKLREVQEKFGLEITRPEEGITFRQAALGIEKIAKENIRNGFQNVSLQRFG